MQPDNKIISIISAPYHMINLSSFIGSFNFGLPIIFLLLIIVIMLVKYSRRQKEHHALQSKRYELLNKENEKILNNLKVIHSDAEKNTCKFDLSPPSVPTNVSVSTTSYLDKTKLPPFKVPAKSSGNNTPTSVAKVDQAKLDATVDEDVEITPVLLPKTPVVPPMFITDDEISKAIDTVEVVGRKKLKSFYDK